MRVTEQELEALSIGAAILGTGGGGDPLIGKLMAQQAVAEYGPVDLISLDDISEGDVVFPVAMMGAPTVFLEKLPAGEEGYLAVRRMERHLGKKVTVLCPIECGGMNSMIPFVVAARMGLPVVDGDGMGRAFPELQMETFHVLGVPGTPACIADEWGNVVLFETVDNYRLESFARACTVKMGGYSHLVDYPMTGSQLRDTAVRGTISMAIRLGNAIQAAQRSHVNPVQAALSATRDTIYGHGIPLFQGKVVDVSRRTSNGFAVGSAQLQGFDEDAGKTMVIDFQNENLIAKVGERVVASVPDLITLLDPDTGYAITNERLRYGQRVVVVGIPTPEIMRSEAALDVWGPQQFGYDIAFVPLEQAYSDFYRNVGVPKEKEKYLLSTMTGTR
ncbi:DUF917 domain-containing protein [Alicyclobacillus fastidiosus]|uniref:DUF917 domain-containing protein n=1 Tax=Alicyclobacillus fastidiosus TaxID=392011 RepID=A0ABV5AEA7_9BACL|nr:DUF917 domain-containing protein [Alicyclobacillus fastidiosus]WEH09813.1 DUF917 domain-containing protein [Alicyclobacillus fastidiosus]